MAFYILGLVLLQDVYHKTIDRHLSFEKTKHNDDDIQIRPPKIPGVLLSIKIDVDFAKQSFVSMSNPAQIKLDAKKHGMEDMELRVDYRSSGGYSCRAILIKMRAKFRCSQISLVLTTQRILSTESYSINTIAVISLRPVR